MDQNTIQSIKLKYGKTLFHITAKTGNITSLTKLKLKDVFSLADAWGSLKKKITWQNLGLRMVSQIVTIAC